mgnify:CR=1 FL=1
MSGKTFFWIEDRKGKAGYTFWSTFFEQLCPKIVLESKKNSSELVKAVKNLEDADHKYIVVLDDSFDNLQAVMERKLLKQYAEKKNHVILMDVICFEYILLEFQALIEWIYAVDDEFLEKRAISIDAREKLVGCIQSGSLNYKELRELAAYDRYKNEHNIEQLVAKLLFDLTRNTGFEVSKGSIGDCWIKSCCEWQNRMENDICGLDDGRLSVYEKMKHIYEGTSLKKQFERIGVEVAV